MNRTPWIFTMWMPSVGRIVKKEIIADSYAEAEGFAKRACGAPAIVLSYM